MTKSSVEDPEVQEVRVDRVLVEVVDRVLEAARVLLDQVRARLKVMGREEAVVEVMDREEARVEVLGRVEAQLKVVGRVEARLKVLDQVEAQLKVVDTKTPRVVIRRVEA